MDKNIISNKQFDEERALYGIANTVIENCRFDGPADGESAFKECEDIVVKDCYFNLRYPFWHVTNGVIQNAMMTQNCRAALWYDANLVIENSKLYGIKAFRECRDITISDCDVESPEFLWRCDGVKMQRTTIRSEYPLFETKNVFIEGLNLQGKYSFQYVENMTIKNATLDTKDAFWHSKNVTIEDSFVKGEYLGWYAENLKFIRCKIVGTQPLCYCKNLILEDCTMEETDLSFERSSVTAVIKGRVEGIKNPKSGSIKADAIGDLLIEEAYVNAGDTRIQCEQIDRKCICDRNIE